MRVLTCAIHQPNLFPRLSTLAKLYTADIWIVLDDVQFNHRDYQHRARLAALDDVTRQQWLSLPVHRPFGRSTRINEVLLLDPDTGARRVLQLVQQHYGRAPHWHELRGLVQEVAAAVAVSPRLADVTEVSTRLLLAALGWRGSVIRSSELAARQERSARLADLALAVGADEYLCGPGGAKYLNEVPFKEYGIRVRYVGLPDDVRWQAGRKVSALYWMTRMERALLRDVFDFGASTSTADQLRVS
jgi:WbqC-like protein family